MEDWGVRERRTSKRADTAERSDCNGVWGMGARDRFCLEELLEVSKFNPMIFSVCSVVGVGNL